MSIMGDNDLATICKVIGVVMPIRVSLVRAQPAVTIAPALQLASVSRAFQLFFSNQHLFGQEIMCRA
jgi:hypothetical protein